MTVSDNSKENAWIPECCSGLFRQSFPRAHHGPPPVVPVRHQNVSGHFDLIYYLITTLKEEAGGWIPVREDFAGAQSVNMGYQKDESRLIELLNELLNGRITLSKLLLL